MIKETKVVTNAKTWQYGWIKEKNKYASNRFWKNNIVQKEEKKK